jgi:hypothetical protein
MFKFYISLVLSVSFLAGCAVKTPLAKVKSLSSLSDKVLIIGSFSRPIGKNYFRSSSIELHDMEGKLIDTIFIQGKENIMSPLNPYEFTDDYTYSDAKGSVFAKLIPAGQYYLTQFSTGHALLQYFSDYSVKLKLNAGEIVYIGDIKFIPTKITPSILNGNTVSSGAKCVISNQLKRDFSTFKKYYPNDFFKEEEIKIYGVSADFDLNGYSNNSSQVVIPAVIHSVILPSM